MPYAFRPRTDLPTPQTPHGKIRSSLAMPRHRRPLFEELEPRFVLDGSVLDYELPVPAWFDRVVSTPPAVESFVGPLTGAGGSDRGPWPDSAEVAQWIVRLKPEATRQAGSVAGTAALLDTGDVAFQILRGLGLPGQVLVRTEGPSGLARAALNANALVATFEPDAYFFAQAPPNDSSFSSLFGLHNTGQFGLTEDADIDALEAWGETTGSTNVVVGVVDSGVDLTHPDLYANIWINQGEIPARFDKRQLDIDGDGRVTFDDLNDPRNAATVSDANENGYIDAEDLLNDPRWADGVDTDHNAFVDDFFGWNFRSATNEPYAPNDPRDALGHGTHVAGTIGANGNNGIGVTGINWRVSLMSLKFLDTSNSGQTSDAVAAVNYATMMRHEGEQVRVLNASWGQSGGESPALRSAIEAADQAEILFVAASGNGNILGQGISLDREPFYPASYDLPNVIAVAASGPHDELARFSNYGAKSVDLAAPGVGILSTLPGGRYGTQNGTSMAAPHVAGVAALILSVLPDASNSELREAVLATAEPKTGLLGATVTGGRLNAQQALNSKAFAPRATLVSSPDITNAEGTENRIIVRYRDRQGLNASSLGDGDIVVTRHWGPPESIPTTLLAVNVEGATSMTATYRVAAPGGTWDTLDFGRYVVAVVEDQVTNRNGRSVAGTTLGEFFVQVATPLSFYVSTFSDAVDARVGDGICAAASGECTLRAAVQEANAASPNAATIVLHDGTYRLSIPSESALPAVSANSPPLADCYVGKSEFGPASEQSGDLDIRGSVSIFGNSTEDSRIDAGSIDRLFRIHPGASLSITRLTATNGKAENGGAILAAGNLELDLATVEDSSAAGNGGAIAVWDGTTRVRQSTLQGNDAARGGGLFVCTGASLDVVASTIADNTATIGAALATARNGPTSVVNSTISGNASGRGSVVSGAIGTKMTLIGMSSDGRFIALELSVRDVVPPNTSENVNIYAFERQEVVVYDRLTRTTEPIDFAGARVSSLTLSANGRFIAFDSYASTLVSGDTNSRHDVFLYDREDRSIQRVSVAGDGTEGNGDSDLPSISADGRFVAYRSRASNLVLNDRNDDDDFFIFDRENGAVERVNIPNDVLTSPTLSADGRFLAFDSSASNVMPDDTNLVSDVFLYDLQNQTIDLVSVAPAGVQANGGSYSPVLSADGRFVAFESYASNLVPGDANGTNDIFVYDRQNKSLDFLDVTRTGPRGNDSRISLSADGRFVAFSSFASDVVPGDTNASTDVFVFDRQDRTPQRVSVASGGTEGNGGSGSAFLSADGRFVAFESVASNLVDSDTNPLQDAFVYDRQNLSLELLDQRIEPIRLESVTIANNDGYYVLGGSTSIHNSLIAGNDTFIELGAGTQSAGSNVVASWEPFLSVSDIVASGASTWLGPLQDNGGPTLSHAIFTGSPAIDAGDVTNYPFVDQRGHPRPQDGNGTNGPRADVGAFEVYSGAITGTLFRDLDRDGVRDPNEPGMPGHDLFVDSNHNGTVEPDEPVTRTLRDNPATLTKNELGAYVLPGLSQGGYRIVPPEIPQWSPTGSNIARASLVGGRTQANSASRTPSLSADGRYMAFDSVATNLVPRDTNESRDVFVFDRQEQTHERVNIANGGTESEADFYTYYYPRHPAISADGRFVAFESSASNLVPDDNNGNGDVFVFDRRDKIVSRVSVASGGAEGNGYSYAPTISADGRFVAFKSMASNLVSGDVNASQDVFVYDLRNHSMECVTDRTQPNEDGVSYYSIFPPSLSADGRFVAFHSAASSLVPQDTNSHADVFVVDRELSTTERIGVDNNGDSYLPTLSADGQFVVFSSDASNLVPDDTNSARDVFVYDRQRRQIRRVSVDSSGQQAVGRSSLSAAPTISADHRFVAFESEATNLVAGDSNGVSDIFVYDLQTATVERVSVASDGQEANAASDSPYLSADGRVIAFSSYASNLVRDDTNAVADIFVVANRRSVTPNARTVSLFAGQELTGIDFGFVPNPGTVRGRCFDDVIANGIYDRGEPGRVGCVAYLDSNGNGERDESETTLPATGADGLYEFAGLDSEQVHRVAVDVPPDTRLVFPLGQDPGVWSIYLPAGGLVAERDFGFRPLGTLVQSENASVFGRSFEDRDGNGRQDAGDPGLSGVTLFLDLNDNGIREFNEPRTVSENNGDYSFVGLGDRNYAVRVQAPLEYQQTSPLGNSLGRKNYSLAISGSLLGSPMDVVAADLNGDTWPDLITAAYDRNAVSILLNDQHGGFVLPPVDVSLAPVGLGPVALMTGDFNGRGGTDVAVVNSLSSNVAILLDFGSGTFGHIQYVDVSGLPSGIGSGKLDADSDLDLIVTSNSSNLGGGKNLALLRNDGEGRFTVDAASPVTGSDPAGVATGFFNSDTLVDFVVADFGADLYGDRQGNVRVFVANVGGGYTSSVACAVGFGPSTVTASDLDGDGTIDLAVGNFLSDNITICRGNGNGSFQAVATLSGGSGPMDVVAQDIDGDRDPDLLVTNGKSKDVGILRNESTPGRMEFQAAESFGVADFPGEARISLTIADLDKNGVVDLAIANSDENRMLVSLNTLVGGARRLAIAGNRDVSGINFGFRAVSPPPLPDDDRDGISNAEESQAPNGGDGNYDGISDSNQLHVASLRKATGSYVTLAVPSHMGLENVHFSQPATNPPPDLDFSLGLLDYRVTNVAPGGTAVVTIFPEQSSGFNAYYKFGPTPDDRVPHWYRFLYDGQTGAVMLPDRIVVYLIDGKRGDDDLTANGVIVDPGAPAVYQHLRLWQNSDIAANVNGDGVISPLDALLVINELNAHGGHVLPALLFPITDYLFLDVNGDDFVTVNDVLLIIDDLNTRGGRPIGQREPSRTAVGEPDTVAGAFRSSAFVPEVWTSRNESICRQLWPHSRVVCDLPVATHECGSLVDWPRRLRGLHPHRSNDVLLNAWEAEWEDVASDVALAWSRTQGTDG